MGGINDAKNKENALLKKTKEDLSDWDKKFLIKNKDGQEELGVPVEKTSKKDKKTGGTKPFKVVTQE